MLYWALSWLFIYILFKVLPGRTHPEMTTSGGGGYLLSAIRVFDCPSEMLMVANAGGLRRGKKRKVGKTREEASPSPISEDDSRTEATVPSEQS